MIQRADRPFLGIWRGSREFTELRRGERVLWQKEVAEEPKEKLTTLTVTAASYADLALLDMVLWVLGQGYAGHVVANIRGEYHTLGGTQQLATVLSSVEENDGCSARLSIGEGSGLHVESLHAGETISVELVLGSKGMEWLSKSVGDELVAVELPCLLPESGSAVLYGFPSAWDEVWRNVDLSVNGVYLKTVRSGSYVFGSSSALVGIATGLSTEQVNAVLSETSERPLQVEFAGVDSDRYTAEDSGFKLAWNAINKTINLIVI